jgi:prepilin signal peptidase PulO-like enzyme (type II secretory pathway)
MSCDYFRKVIPGWICLGAPWFALLFSLWPATRVPSALGSVALAHALGLPPQSAFLPPVLVVSGWLTGFLALEGFRRIMGKLSGLEVMGMGDSYLLGLIGAFAGPATAALTVLPASLLGILHWPYFRWVRGIDHLPFGPALAMGAWLTLFLQAEMLSTLEAMMTLVQDLAGRARIVIFLLLLASLCFLVWRIRRRAAHYAASIEADYAQLDEELKRHKSQHKGKRHP